MLMVMKLNYILITTVIIIIIIITIILLSMVYLFILGSECSAT